jgi:hypothetical protein
MIAAQYPCEVIGCDFLPIEALAIDKGVIETELLPMHFQYLPHLLL